MTTPDALTSCALTLDPADLAGLAVLGRIAGVLALDERESADRCAALARGLSAVVSPSVARVLVTDARSPAEIARRVLRMRDLSLLASEMRERAAR